MKIILGSFIGNGDMGLGAQVCVYNGKKVVGTYNVDVDLSQALTGADCIALAKAAIVKEARKRGLTSVVAADIIVAFEGLDKAATVSTT